MVKYDKFLSWLGVDSGSIKPQELGKILFEFFSEVNKLKKELNTENKKKNLGSSMSYNPRYQDVMRKNTNENASPISENPPKQSQIKNQENSANDDLANILNSSLGNKVSTKMRKNTNENASPISGNPPKQSQIKNQENSANDDVANILNSSLGNKVSTKRVWKQSSDENNSKPTVKTDDEKTEEKARKESAAGSLGFSIGTEDELVDFLSDFTKNCQQRRRTIKRRPKVQI